ncbi:MAG TPA: hypothetical protein VMY05_06255 [Acidobacteriota bacterium]|nr:hypothetical protein [Acidobacteriota bacterium]
MIRRIFFILPAAVLLLIVSDARGIRPKDQAVTWADFNYISSVASSMTHVYFATPGGIIRYNKLESRWELPLTGAEGMENEQPARVWVEHFDDYLYVRTGSGLYEYNRLFDRWYPINELPDIESDNEHIATPQDLIPSTSLNFVESQSVVDPYNRTYPIVDVLDDQSGDLWIGTWGYGAGVAGSSARLLELLPYGLVQNQVNTLYRDDSLLWIAGWMGNSYRTGLTAFNVNDNSFAYLESGVQGSFPASDIYCLEGDSVALYIGTADGLYVADLQRWQVVERFGRRQGLSDFEILALEKRHDSLFVGTGRGLDLIDLATDSIGHVYANQFGGRLIYDLEVIGDFLWIGSDIGAYRLSLVEGNLQRFDDPHGVLFARVYDIESYGNKVWFASDDGLLSLDMSSGETVPFRDFTRRAGGRALAVNDRIAAAASDRGMTLIFLDRRDRFSREFTTDDGLASSTVNALLLDGDYIWVGTDLGLTRFFWNNPDRID